MKERHAPWCTLSDDWKDMICRRCGARETVKLPAPAESVALRMKAFVAEHEHCKPSEQGADNA